MSNSSKHTVGQMILIPLNAKSWTAVQNLDAIQASEILGDHPLPELEGDATIFQVTELVEQAVRKSNGNGYCLVERVPQLSSRN